jgi:hypothetical protein
MSTFKSFGHKIAAIAAATTLIAGFALFTPSSASASGTTHKFKFSGNNTTVSPGSGLSVETKAKVSVKCDSVTGLYSVTVKNVSVIGQDRTAFTTDAGQFVVLLLIVGGPGYTLHLTQNPKNELFDVSTGGHLADPAAECKTATPGIPNVGVLGLDSGDSVAGYEAVGEFS